MFFPFPLQSLTKPVDDQIHRIIRNNNPVKYWSFRISEAIGAFGMTMMLITLFTSFIFLELFQVQIPAGSPEYQRAIEWISRLIVVFGFLGVIGMIIRFGLYDKLQPLVQSAAHSIKTGRG